MRADANRLPILYLTFQELKVGGRLLDDSPVLASEYATVQDEEILSLSTADGGEAWLWGPGGATDLRVTCEVDVLTPALVGIFFDYATEGPPTIAVWQDLTDSRPIAMILVGAGDAFVRPQGWPEPTHCLDADALFSDLRAFVTHP